MLKFYRCSVCGNLIELINDSGALPVCCGRTMELLTPGMTNGAKEKHIPVCIGHSDLSTDFETTSDSHMLTVQVGTALHPMSIEHFIQWIVLLTDQGVYRKVLTADQEPRAKFHVQNDEKVLAVYSYCNLHGLWINTLG